MLRMYACVLMTPSFVLRDSPSNLELYPPPQPTLSIPILPSPTQLSPSPKTALRPSPLAFLPLLSQQTTIQPITRRSILSIDETPLAPSTQSTSSSSSRSPAVSNSSNLPVFPLHRALLHPDRPVRFQRCIMGGCLLGHHRWLESLKKGRRGRG